jgi:hypothetical protein
LVERALDLLGDPIPEGYDGKGRPPHVADDRKRNKVMLLLAMGWTNGRIAAALGLDVKTLRKHYSQQLRTREVALDKMRAGRLTVLWEEMEKGSIPAAKEIGKEIGRIEALTFGDLPAHSDRHAPRDRKAGAQQLGKKEVAKIAAASAGAGTEWGDDLIPPTMN